MVNTKTGAAPPMWSLLQLQNHLNVSGRTIHRLIRSNGLPHLKVGGQLRFRPHEVEMWLNNNASEVC